MKDLVRTLLLGGALSVLAGGAIANQVEELHCQQSECAFDEELGPSQTRIFHGYCAGEKVSEYKMVCHAVKGTTCTKGVSVASSYWSCTCTNWDPTQRKYVTIDILCDD